MYTFKEKDKVRVISLRFAPETIISKIDEQNQSATCVRFDTKSKRYITESLPLNILEVVPPSTPLSKDDLLGPLGLH